MALAVVLCGCSVMGGVIGDRLDRGTGSNHFSNAFFAAGATVDGMLIKGELDRRRAKKAIAEDEDQLPNELSCDFHKQRKVCSALEGCEDAR